MSLTYKCLAAMLRVMIAFITKALRWVVKRNKDDKERAKLIEFVKQTFKEELEDELK